jgi:hypothetical protein
MNLNTTEKIRTLFETLVIVIFGNIKAKVLRRCKWMSAEDDRK